MLKLTGAQWYVYTRTNGRKFKLFWKHGGYKQIMQDFNLMGVQALRTTVSGPVPEIIIKTFHAQPNHHANTPMLFTSPYTQLLYSKTGVYRGVYNFLIFALKHRPLVLVHAQLNRK